ncbi:hypothetical protein ICW40_07515 [Actinotalea ferrariae]|uniref:hypothetical protein n=1 Tax=Actinotalea ferrariae TaxID=1386098 RepID=UPI001C8BD431|nr:hypothetical protein [Actinotalea ferrariae]MBX9244657.1 hypothetical protein [Actinotalea ferrariae]
MTPETRLGGFVAYATARPTARASAIRQAVGGDYNVVQDFYLRFRRAVTIDRQGPRDGAAIAAVVASATPKKARKFAELAANWPKVSQRWANTSPATIDRASVTTAGLTVTVAPSFVERDTNGELEIVIMGYAAERLSAADIDMILRVVQRAYAPLHPAARVAYVDLAHARVRTTEGQDLRRHDVRIDTDAAGLAYAMRNAA